MALYTNKSNLPLSVAVWLAQDNYDHDSRPNQISATSLLKPIRQIVLESRLSKEQRVVDIVGLVPSRIGSAVHDSLETAWTTNHKENLINLGFNPRVVDRIVVNPDPKKVTEDEIPVYLEQRAEKEVQGMIISGKYDFIGEGRVEDLKFTTVYKFINGTSDEDYIMQGSIYRWLNPEIITRDDMAIQFVFKDWAASRCHEKNYPQAQTVEHKLVLNSYEETDAFVNQKVKQIKRYWDADEKDLPECSDKDLWRKPDVWKYYKNPDKTARSTKNFDNEAEANAMAAMKGGIVIKKGGEITACKYCPVFDICTQKDKYLASGELILRGL